MSRIRAFGGALALGALLSAPALAQQEWTQNRSEASVQALGSFVKTTTDNGVQQGATNSGGVLASYRFYFTPKHGVELNYGYALNSQTYGLADANLRVRSHAHEATAAYVFRYPLRRFSPFVLAGVGGLVFDPQNTALLNAQARPAFLYGGGADFNLTRHIFFRAEYRGLVYSSPNFDSAVLNVDRVTHRAEPAGGFGFRF